MYRPSRRALLRLGSAVGLAGLAGCSAPRVETRDEETRTLSTENVASLTVENVTGSVAVETWGDDAVELRVVKRGFFTDDLGGVTVEATTEGGTLVVRRVAPQPTPRIIVDLTLRVPADLPVTDVQTSNGGVDVRGTTGDLVARTTNGGVTVRQVDGFVTLSTTNGGITCRDVGGVDDARTTNGGVAVEVPAVRGDTVVETTNGGVDVAVGRSLDAELVAETTNGSVDARDLSLSNVSASRTRLSGTLGDGGPTLSVGTTNGDVELSLLSE